MKKSAISVKIVKLGVKIPKRFKGISVRIVKSQIVDKLLTFEH